MKSKALIKIETIKITEINNLSLKLNKEKILWSFIN